MPLWFREAASAAHNLEWKVTKTLYSGQSQYQRIEFVETEQFGHALVLDGIMQTTSGDQHIYHEMLAGVPLAAHPAPKRVLILGGGDGGLLTTVLRDARVDSVTMVEIDEEVVTLSKKYLPMHTAGFDDPRLTLLFQDGAQFLKNLSQSNHYDVILVDSTDPDTTAGRYLYTTEFHQDVRAAMNDGGIYVQHSGSPFYDPEVLQNVSRDVTEVFPMCQVYWTTIPTYPGSFFSFTAGTVNRDISRPIHPLDWETRWYTPDLHHSAFALPREVAKLLPESALLPQR